MDITERKQAEAEIESSATEPGKSTRFVVKLPRLPTDWGKPQDTKGTEPSPRTSVKGRIILVVDDEEGIRAILARMLGEQHELVVVASGREAQAVDLHAWLREQDPGLADKVVFMTGGPFTPRLLGLPGENQERPRREALRHRRVSADGRTVRVGRAGPRLTAAGSSLHFSTSPGRVKGR